DHESERNPFGLNYSGFDTDSLTREMPDELRQLWLAEVKPKLFLPELAMRTVSNGYAITSAIWSIDGAVYCSEPSEQFVFEGRGIIEYELLPVDRAIAEWAGYYGLTDDMIAFV